MASRWNFRVSVPDRMKEACNTVCGVILLLLCFLVPVQPILPIKTFRLVELTVLLLGAATFAAHGPVRVPALIQWSFWVGLAGWIVSTAFSSDLKRSVDIGILEFLVFYLVLYLAVVHFRDRRDLVRAAILFAAGAAIVAVTQTVTIISLVQKLYDARSLPLSLPFLASDFFRYKAAVPQVLPEGVPNSYGNIDGYASLCALLLPWLLGLFYVSRFRWLILILFLVHSYAALTVYSRGTMLVFAGAVCALWLFRFRANGQLSPAIVAVLLGTILLHADDKVISSFGVGTSSFFSTIAGPPAVSEASSPDVTAKPDNSAIQRAQALSTGFSMAMQSQLVGVGYGAYPTIDPVLTSPHSLAVLRFAEGGLLSLVSILMLAIYAPWRLLQAYMGAEKKNMFEAACLCAASAFMAKAIVFGANFSVSSNFVWGFGLALCLAGSLCERQDPAVTQVGFRPADVQLK